MANRQITKKELLLAISASEYNEVTHVHYIPPRCNYTKMLKVLRAQGFVEPMASKYYKLTQKGKNYILRQTPGEPDFTKQDAEIDKFVDDLT